MRGFTLIEMLVTIFVLALISGALAGVVIMLYQTQGYSWQQSQAIYIARQGINVLVKEIREARTSDDGSYIIEKADEYEFIFYSDIDKDNEVERVRYLIEPAGGSIGTQTQNCVSYVDGGTCSVIFSGFLNNTLNSATIRIVLEGDIDRGNETIEVFADSQSLGVLCNSGCGQCAGNWQGLTIFDVTNWAEDDAIIFLADASSRVNPICQWQEPDHSFKASFEFSWEEVAGSEQSGVLKKGITKPVGWPPEYLLENEKVFIIGRDVRNETRGEPVFLYYDEDNNLLDAPARLEKTTLMNFRLIINVDPSRPPDDFELSSSVQLRNLKTNL